MFFLSYDKNFLRNTIKVSNSLDPDLARHFVWPDLGPNCLQTTDRRQTTLVGKELIMSRQTASSVIGQQLNISKITQLMTPVLKLGSVAETINSLNYTSGDSGHNP